MSWNTFETACDSMKNSGDDVYVTIGGGEPLLHPRVFGMLRKLSTLDDVHASVITNGGDTKRALRLLDMHKEASVEDEPWLTVRLSSDEFHDEIDSHVYDAYAELNLLNEPSVWGPIRSGRCDWGRDDCVCFGPFVTPDGAVNLCGCFPRYKTGHVTDPFGLYDTCPDVWGFECSKSMAEAGFTFWQNPLPGVEWYDYSRKGFPLT